MFARAKNHAPRLWRVITLATLALTAQQSVQAAPILTFNEATGGNAPQFGQSLGWQFDVLFPLTVTGLGWFDEGADGLFMAHMVGIWDPSGSLLASILVPAGTVAPLDGQFRTAAITPLNLSSGVGYIVGGENFAANTERIAGNVVQTVDPRINYVAATFRSAAGFERPTEISGATTGLYGPSFSVLPPAAVPEPGTLALTGLGMLGVLAWVRRRRKTG